MYEDSATAKWGGNRAGIPLPCTNPLDFVPTLKVYSGLDYFRLRPRVFGGTKREQKLWHSVPTKSRR
uniref:Uncharacterized protein n=1 Tax=Magnetospirillum gryphiswaldense TaxID=55518 RepID=A4U4R7_9PROT|nr:hypothetical protein MGR_3942 [Magnetospirillum gryphiswaldense MSR-1]